MLFLIDAQLPPALTNWFEGRGHSALAVRDIGLRDASDREIWEYAVQRSAVVVTKDQDFVQLAAVSRPAAPVLWIRCGNVTNTFLIDRLDAIWGQAVGHLESGILVVEVR